MWDGLCLISGFLHSVDARSDSGADSSETTTAPKEGTPKPSWGEAGGICCWSCPPCPSLWLSVAGSLSPASLPHVHVPHDPNRAELKPARSWVPGEPGMTPCPRSCHQALEDSSVALPDPACSWRIRWCSGRAASSWEPLAFSRKDESGEDSVQSQGQKQRSLTLGL